MDNTVVEFLTKLYAKANSIRDEAIAQNDDVRMSLADGYFRSIHIASDYFRAETTEAFALWKESLRSKKTSGAGADVHPAESKGTLTKGPEWAREQKDYPVINNTEEAFMVGDVEVRPVRASVGVEHSAAMNELYAKVLKDPNLDYYAEKAAEQFHKPVSEVTREERRLAKNSVLFSLYGGVLPDGTSLPIGLEDKWVYNFDVDDKHFCGVVVQDTAESAVTAVNEVYSKYYDMTAVEIHIDPLYDPRAVGNVFEIAVDDYGDDKIIQSADACESTSAFDKSLIMNMTPEDAKRLAETMWGKPRQDTDADDSANVFKEGLDPELAPQFPSVVAEHSEPFRWEHPDEKHSFQDEYILKL